MKRSTTILGSSTGLLAAAAFAGLIGGASNRATAAATMPGISHSTAAKAAVVANAGTKARTMDGATTQHDCKGNNDCKGQGGCKSGDNGCKGQNSCKGKGGCKTSGSALAF
ncbi:MAG: hypothetical protein ABSD28_00950 [Tepidisphaeraceae bacterium]|jgi:hypothetical protein